MVQAREDGHAFLAPSRVPKKRFSSGIDTSLTIRIEKPKNNMERRLLRRARTLVSWALPGGRPASQPGSDR